MSTFQQLEPFRGKGVLEVHYPVYKNIIGSDYKIIKDYVPDFSGSNRPSDYLTELKLRPDDSSDSGGNYTAQLCLAGKWEDLFTPTLLEQVKFEYKDGYLVATNIEVLSQDWSIEEFRIYVTPLADGKNLWFDVLKWRHKPKDLTYTTYYTWR